MRTSGLETVMVASGTMSYGVVRVDGGRHLGHARLDGRDERPQGLPVVRLREALLEQESAILEHRVREEEPIRRDELDAADCPATAP